MPVHEGGAAEGDDGRETNGRDEEVHKEPPYHHQENSENGKGERLEVFTDYRDGVRHCERSWKCGRCVMLRVERKKKKGSGGLNSLENVETRFVE